MSIMLILKLKISEVLFSETGCCAISEPGPLDHRFRDIAGSYGGNILVADPTGSDKISKVILVVICSKYKLNHHACKQVLVVKTADFCLVLLWVQNDFGPSKQFWTSTNCFERAQFVLVGSKLFWTGQNYKNQSPKSNLKVTKMIWI